MNKKTVGDRFELKSCPTTLIFASLFSSEYKYEASSNSCLPKNIYVHELFVGSVFSKDAIKSIAAETPLQAA